MVIVQNCRYGRMMFLPSDVFIGRSYYNYGESHQNEIHLLSQLITAGDVVIDVGANIGSVSIPIAQILGPTGYLVAIEPQMFLYHVLCGNFALNGLTNILALNRNAAAKSGEIYYLPDIAYDEPFNFGGVSCAETGSNPIASIAIDDLNLAKVKLIKIDVEGMELQVLQGARKTIERCQPFLHVEFIDNRPQILEFIESIGYEWHLHEPPLYNPDNHFSNADNALKTSEGVPIASSDLLCWTRDKVMELRSPYFVNLDTSEEPRHKEILELCK